LKNDICDEGAGQISRVACIQKRHIEDDYRRVLLLRDHAPLFEDLLVVATEAVDGLYHQHVAGLELLQEPLIRWPIEVLSGLFVYEYMVAGHTKLPEHD